MTIADSKNQPLFPPRSADPSFAGMPTGLVRLSPAYMDALRQIAPPPRRRRPVRLALVTLSLILGTVCVFPAPRARLLAKLHSVSSARTTAVAVVDPMPPAAAPPASAPAPAPHETGPVAAPPVPPSPAQRANGASKSATTPRRPHRRANR